MRLLLKLLGDTVAVASILAALYASMWLPYLFQ